MGEVFILFKEEEERGPEFRVSPCKLGCQRGEYEPQIPAIVGTTRAEKRGPQTPISEQPLCDCSCYCRLPRPCEPSEPEDRRLIKIFGPLPDLTQHILPRPLKTATPVSVLVPSPMSTRAGLQHLRISYRVIHELVSK